jgi:hypothetical protein
MTSKVLSGGLPPFTSILHAAANERPRRWRPRARRLPYYILCPGKLATRFTRTARLSESRRYLWRTGAIRQDRAVGDIGRCGDNRVDQLGAAVDAEMRCRMHLGIARLVGILGRGRRIDDRVATFSPLTASCRRTSSNSCRPRSMPTNRRIASES